MPAPSSQHHRDHRRELRRLSGSASAASRICPAITPSSAPTIVAAIAAAERNRIEQDDRHGNADQLADRSVLLGGEIDQDTARGDVDAVLLRCAGGVLELLAVLLVEVGRPDVIAHVGGGDASVRETRPSGLNGLLHRLDVRQLRHLAQRAVDGLAVLRSVMPPSSTLKTSVESAPAKAGLWALKRSSSSLRLGVGIE